MRAFEVLTMGRIGVDLYPQQVGVGLDEVESFGKYLGGSASNVAVAAARYGRRTAVITRTGEDPFGTFLHRALRGYGVDDRYVTGVKGLPTPVTFCEIFPPDDFPLYFYRLPKAPDLEIYREELDTDAIREAGVFWVTVTGLSEEPSRTATLAALEARARKDITVLDLDYRPMFWPSREEARRWVQQALPHVTVAVGNLDECDTAVGEREPLAAASKLHDLGVKLAVVKQGPKGVLASLSRNDESPPWGVWGDGSPQDRGGLGGSSPRANTSGGAETGEDLPPDRVVPVAERAPAGHRADPERPAAQHLVLRAEEHLRVLLVRPGLEPRVRQEVRARPLPDVPDQLPGPARRRP
jgi:5-dehydro-2-deoxygluconokinase